MMHQRTIYATVKITGCIMCKLPQGVKKKKEISNVDSGQVAIIVSWMPNALLTRKKTKAHSI